MPYKLIIYEDNLRLRKSMETLLNDGVNFNVVGGFENCNQLQKNLTELNPDVILMDIEMPDITGIQGVKIVKENWSFVKVLMFTVFDDDNRIFEALCNGADGYLLKNTQPAKLIQSLHDVLNGDLPMSPQVAQKVFNHFKKNNLPKANYHLTPRELDVLNLLVKGNSYKMIAAQNSISLDTVKRHLQNVYSKLQVSSGTEAVAKAIKQNIVD